MWDLAGNDLSSILIARSGLRYIKSTSSLIRISTTRRGQNRDTEFSCRPDIARFIIVVISEPACILVIALRARPGRNYLDVCDGSCVNAAFPTTKRSPDRD